MRYAVCFLSMDEGHTKPGVSGTLLEWQSNALFPVPVIMNEIVVNITTGDLEEVEQRIDDPHLSRSGSDGSMGSLSGIR